MGTINDLIKHLDGFSKDLEKLKETKVSIDLDKNDMMQKECPKDNCLAKFLVNVKDWENIFRDEEVFCPTCKESDLAKNFMPSEYLEAVKQQLAKSIKQRWTNGTPIKTDSYKIDVEQPVCNYLYECNTCKARYGTITEANICPSCGEV